jgi:hypothetical protein
MKVYPTLNRNCILESRLEPENRAMVSMNSARDTVPLPSTSNTAKIRWTKKSSVQGTIFRNWSEKRGGHGLEFKICTPELNVIFTVEELDDVALAAA